MVERTSGRRLRGRCVVLGTAVFTVALAAAPLPDDGVAGASVAADRPATAYRPIHPCTALDSAREGGRFEVDEVRTIGVIGRCALGAEVRAVAALVLVGDTGPAPGYVSMWPADAPWPGTSIVNWAGPGERRVTTSIVSVSAEGRVSIMAAGEAHVAMLVIGVFETSSEATAGRTVTMASARILDTRVTGAAPDGSSAMSLPVPRSVPEDSAALIVNVTVVDSISTGDVRIGPASGLDTVPPILTTDAGGQTRASGTIVRQSAEGLLVRSTTGGHVLVDLVGYITGPSSAPSSEGLFVPIVPTRVVDTRSAERLHPNGSQQFEVLPGGIEVAAVTATITAVDPRAEGFVSVFPTGGALPPTSWLNVHGDDVAVANLVVSEVGRDGVIAHSSGGTQLVVDVTGYVIGRPAEPSDVPHQVVNTAPPGPSCEWYPAGRAAIVDRVAQRMWLCADGVAVTEPFPFTAGPVRAAPAGEYRVFFRRDPWWGSGFTLRRFVAFTRGPRGGRVAFHQYVNMPPEMIGSEQYRNVSGGCFRLRPDDSIIVWSFLRIGDPVRILNNG